MSDEGFPPLQNDFAIREEEEEEETNNKSGIVEEEEAEEGENNFSSLVTHLGGVRGIYFFSRLLFSLVDDGQRVFFHFRQMAGIT